MAALIGNLNSIDISHTGQLHPGSNELGSAALLDVVQTCLHTRSSEWIFLREQRVGTGFRSSSAQRLDGFALNCLRARRSGSSSVSREWELDSVAVPPNGSMGSR